MSTDQAIAVLVLNGAVVFFIGMLAGVPYGAIRVRQDNPKGEANWRLSHAQNLQNGLLLLLIGACAPHLKLSDLAMQAMVSLLVIGAYSDVVALTIRAVTGNAGLIPARPAANVVAFAFFSVTH